MIAASSSERGQQKWQPVLRKSNQALRRLRKLICGPRSHSLSRRVIPEIGMLKLPKSAKADLGAANRGPLGLITRWNFRSKNHTRNLYLLVSL